MGEVGEFCTVVLEAYCRQCGTVRAQVRSGLRWGRTGRVTCPGCGRRLTYQRVGRAMQVRPWHVATPRWFRNYRGHTA